MAITYPVELLPADGPVPVRVEEAEDSLQLFAISVHGIEHGLACTFHVLGAVRQLHVELRHEGTGDNLDNKQPDHEKKHTHKHT